MSLSILLWGVGFWASAFVPHVLLWRMRRPVDDLRALVFMFTGMPAAVAGVALGAGMPWTATALSLLFALALGAAYSFWYPAAQAASPTMLICVKVGACGKAGMDTAHLRQALSADLLTRETFANLFAERFAFLEGDRVRVAPRGRRTLKSIQAFRWMAGFKEPKG